MIGTWAWGTGSAGGKIVFGKKYDEQQLRDTFMTAYKAGFTFWDTAEVYGMGTAEKLLGSLIKDNPVIISTKHFPNKKYKDGENRTALTASLDRLRVKQADLYWLHSPKNIPENMKELASLQKEGLIKNIGLSNGDVSQISLAQKVLKENGSSLSAIQNHYSLLAMEREADVLEYCKKNNILFFGYMLLEQGALSGHYDAGNHFPTLSMRGLSFGKGKFKKIQPLIDYIRQLAKKYNMDSAQVAVIWAISKGIIPIVGLTKPKHAETLKSGIYKTFTYQELSELERLALESGVKCKGSWE